MRLVKAWMTVTRGSADGLTTASYHRPTGSNRTPHLYLTVGTAVADPQQLKAGCLWEDGESQTTEEMTASGGSKCSWGHSAGAHQAQTRSMLPRPSRRPHRCPGCASEHRRAESRVAWPSPCPAKAPQCSAMTQEGGPGEPTLPSCPPCLAGESQLTEHWACLPPGPQCTPELSGASWVGAAPGLADTAESKC